MIAIKGITQIIEQVRQISSAIASAVEEQGAATQEIARNVGQAAQGTQEVSTNIAGLSEAAGMTGLVAEKVLLARSASAKAEKAYAIRSGYFSMASARADCHWRPRLDSNQRHLA